MKKLLILLSGVALLTAAASSPQEKYIKKYSALAVSEMERTGVPASITMAQAILESRSGESPLATKANNHFGIKCHKDWNGRTFYQDDDSKEECFRVYASPEESFMDHSDFLRNRDRYKDLFDINQKNYKAWARGLKKAGYATDPSYASKLIKVIEDYELYRLDEGVRAVPESPSDSETRESGYSSTEITSTSPEFHAKEVVDFPLTRKEFTIDGVPFIRAMEGESYDSIAEYYGLRLKELLRYNGLKINETLQPGTIVYLQPIRSRSARKNKLLR